MSPGTASDHRWTATPPWRETLSAEERAFLDPGPGALDAHPDVLVVGGGIVGVAAARACAEAGLGRVVLIDRSALAPGATAGAAGLLTPAAHDGVDPDHFVSLGYASLERWRRLNTETPAGLGVVEIDWIDLEGHDLEGHDLEGHDDESQGTGRFARPAPAGAEPLSVDQVARLVPSLTAPVPGWRIRQARVNPVMAAARLAGAGGGRAPLSVATRIDVRGVGVRGQRVVSVDTSEGAITPGAVLFATGGPPDVVGLDLDVASGWMKGHMVLTAPSDLEWPGGVASLATTIGDGRLLVGGSLDVGDSSDEVRPTMIDAMHAYVASFLSPSALGRVTHGWCCFRPYHPDHLPVIDRIPGLDNAWVTSGHFRTGILLAPATGQALAEWVAGGRRPPAVEGFGADRF